jgi:hypothetical protein
MYDERLQNFGDDYDYMYSLETRVWLLEQEVEDLADQVIRLKQALIDAGVHPSFVELIAAGRPE